MKTKISLLLVVLVIACCALIACGDDPAETTTAPSSNATTTVDPAPTTPPPTTTTSPVTTTVVPEQPVDPSSKTFTGVALNGYTGTYDGSEHTVTLTGHTAYPNAAITFTYDNASSLSPKTFKDAGTYTVSVKLSQAGYTDFTASAQVVINPAPLTVTLTNQMTVDAGTSYAAVLAQLQENTRINGLIGSDRVELVYTINGVDFVDKNSIDDIVTIPNGETHVVCTLSARVANASALGNYAVSPIASVQFAVKVGAASVDWSPIIK